MSIFPKNFVDDYDEAGFGVAGGHLIGLSSTAPRRSSSRSSQKSSSSFDDSAVGAICCDVEEAEGFQSSVLTNALDEFLHDDETFEDDSMDLFAQNNLNMSDMLEDQHLTQDQSLIGSDIWRQQMRQQQETEAYNGQAEQSLEHDHMPEHLESLFGMIPTDFAQQPSSSSAPLAEVDLSQSRALVELLKQMAESSAPIAQQPAMQQHTSTSNPTTSAQTIWSDQFLGASIMSTASSHFPEDQSPVCAPSSSWVKADDEWIGPAGSSNSNWTGPSMFASLSEVPALHAQQNGSVHNSMANPRPIASHLNNSVLFPRAVAEPSSSAAVAKSTINPLIFANTPHQTPSQVVQSSFGTPRSVQEGVFKEPLPPSSVSRMPSFDANSFASSVLPSPALSTLSDFSPLQGMADVMADGTLCPSSGKASKLAADGAAGPYLKMRKSRVKPGDPAEGRKYTAPSQTSRKTISSAIAKKHGISIDALGNPVRPDGITDEQWEEMNPIRAQIQADIKREKNREAQRVSRQKRQEEMQMLQDQMLHWQRLAESLQAENETLKQCNASLQEQVSTATAASHAQFRQPNRHASY